MHVVLRRRGLPAGEEYPDPIRTDPSSARPGHTAHHRGELVVNVGMLIHRGSAQCAGLVMCAGNPSTLQGIAVTLSRLKEICARDEQDPGRVITVIDGEGRGPACVGELVKAGVHFVTRSDERRILDDSELRHRLNEAEWFLVPDSGSGPARYAIDIGERVMPVTDEAGDLREVTVRLVLTRHRSKRCSKRAGRTIGSYHYELFATQLPRDAFGPEDIVNL